MNLKKLYRSIGNNERRHVAIVSAFIAAVTSLPPVLGILIGQARGMVWNGIQFLSPGDMGVYLSYIQQAKSGVFLFENLFTTEYLFPVFNVLWFSVGTGARIFSLSPIAAYHVSRLLLIPILMAVLYLAASYFFSDIRKRLWSFYLLAFSSGIGIYFSSLFTGVPEHEWPIDLWTAEANVFMSSLYSPHFVASWILLVSAMLLLMMAFETKRHRYAIFAGTAAVILFQFHPFHVLTLYAVPIIFLLSRDPRFGKVGHAWKSFLIFILLSSPSVAYHFFLTHYDEMTRALMEANTTPTPSVWHLFLGFGAISIAWVIGYFRYGKKEYGWKWRFLFFWVVVQAIIIYAPLPFQRRMIEGLQFPLTLLSVPVFLAIADRFFSRKSFWRPISLLLVWLLFLPSTFGAVARSINSYVYNTPPLFYFSQEMNEALEWFRDEATPGSTVLATPNSGYLIAGWSGQTTYAGHWVNTVDLSAKMSDIASYFVLMDDEQGRSFLGDNGIDYVFYGEDERKHKYLPPQFDHLREVFVSGDTMIYELIR